MIVKTFCVKSVNGWRVGVNNSGERYHYFIESKCATILFPEARVFIWNQWTKAIALVHLTLGLKWFIVSKFLENWTLLHLLFVKKTKFLLIILSREQLQKITSKIWLKTPLKISGTNVLISITEISAIRYDKMRSFSKYLWNLKQEISMCASAH